MIRHLFVPGLLGPMPTSASPARQRLPRLERLLAQADRYKASTDAAAELFRIFGFELRPDVDVPTAAVSLFGETGQAPEGYLLHADPLQLMPDRDCLRAFALEDVPLTREERQILLDAFNMHFARDGLSLSASDRGHLYLRCDESPRVRTRPLSDVLGRNLDPYLPLGEGKRYWRGLLNEIQMLCHGLEFNRAREAIGAPVLSGLWFSGGGLLPASSPGRIAELEGESDLARGLLELQSDRGEHELIVERQVGEAALRVDQAAWVEARGVIEARLPALMDGSNAVYVHPCSGDRYQWRPGHAWRFWRRRRRLDTYLAASSGTSYVQSTGEAL